MTKKFAKLWKNLSLCFPFNRSVQEEAYRGVFIIWSADDLDNHTSLLTHSNDRENDLKIKQWHSGGWSSQHIFGTTLISCLCSLLLYLSSHFLQFLSTLPQAYIIFLYVFFSPLCLKALPLFVQTPVHLKLTLLIYMATFWEVCEKMLQIAPLVNWDNKAHNTSAWW